jgi:pimeloyl-ACP methyl ester carboxylesterase
MAATETAPGAATGTRGDVPPVLLFLPGGATQPWNTTARLAEIFRRDLTRGPGTYAVQAAETIDASLSDGQRILDDHGAAVLDMYTVDYRDRLRIPAAARGGLKGLAIRLMLLLWYFARVVVLLFPARKRAKNLVAKVQIAIGFGSALALLLLIIFTFLAILTALGVYKSSAVPDTAADAVALSLTAVSTWVLARFEPTLRNAAVATQNVLDYAEDERHAQGVTSCLADALDAILEQEPTRQINIAGYSLGALVALDYLCPRASTSPELVDQRCREAVRVVVTIGCPLDFIRLFLPLYTANRIMRAPNATWTNIYIPADVWGSSFGDDEDNKALTEIFPNAQMELAHNKRYTDMKLTMLNIWGQIGFLSHVRYWDEVTSGSCLPLVWQALVTRERTIPASR